MTPDEKQLLDNVLDSLDRLSDREFGVVDIHVLIFATAKAVTDSSSLSHLESSAADLEKIICSGNPTQARVDQALHVTNDLRHFLADVLD